MADSGLQRLLGLMTVAAALVAWWIGPVVQDPAYHCFADARPCGLIPNCLNVLSNVGFLLVGGVGLWRLRTWPADLRSALGTFWWGVLLVAPGSAWYHWVPDDTRLVWDRLPMTVAFMALFAAVLMDRLRVGRWILPVLVGTGLAGVGVWALWGDLRPYGLVQFLPMLLMVVILIHRPRGAIPLSALLWALSWYGTAKLAECLDRAFLLWTGLISGHTLKHLLAALATVRLWHPAIEAGGVSGENERFSESRES